jgi:GDP-4-dehydro-6-deoxy-D-mannose reductase
MRILITGIDGFVGSHAAEYLMKLGDVEIHGLLHPQSDGHNIESIRSHLSLHTADVTDVSTLRALFLATKPSRVIHLAGQAYVPTSFMDPLSTFRVNIMGGLSVLEAARGLQEETGVTPEILLISTGEVYGQSTTGMLAETSPLRPGNPYAASKASIDLIGQEYRHAFGLGVKVVRPFNHIGPRQNPAFVCSDFGRQFAMIESGKKSAVIDAGNLDAFRDFTDVRDVVRAYWAILECSSDYPVFNVCSSRAVSIGDVIHEFEAAAGFRVEVRVDETRRRKGENLYLIGDNGRLKKATGWEPLIPFRKTIIDVYNYWRYELAVPR